MPAANVDASEGHRPNGVADVLFDLELRGVGSTMSHIFNVTDPGPCATEKVRRIDMLP
jgi:hypothetical protein